MIEIVLLFENFVGQLLNLQLEILATLRFSSIKTRSEWWRHLRHFFKPLLRLTYVYVYAAYKYAFKKNSL